MFHLQRAPGEPHQPHVTGNDLLQEGLKFKHGFDPLGRGFYHLLLTGGAVHVHSLTWVGISCSSTVKSNSVKSSFLIWAGGKKKRIIMSTGLNFNTLLKFNVCCGLLELREGGEQGSVAEMGFDHGKMELGAFPAWNV